MESGPGSKFSYRCQNRLFSSGDPKWLRETFNIPPERKICLFVRPLTMEKNIEFLIKAFHKVHNADPDTSW
jgi:hypothetical protein